MIAGGGGGSVMVVFFSDFAPFLGGERGRGGGKKK